MRRLGTVRAGSLAPWVGLLVSAGFAYLAVRNVRFSEVWSGLRTSNYWWLVPAFALLALAVSLKAVRWYFLFDRDRRPPLRTILSTTLVGYFFNSILPARSGEAVRIFTLRRRAGTPISEGAATVLMERVYDVLVLLVLLFVATPWLPPVTWLHTAAILAIVLTAALLGAVAVLAVWGLRPVHFALRPLGRLPFVSEERLEHIGDNLGQGLAAMRHPKLMLGALFWSVCGWLALSVSMWLVMRGFHLRLSILAGLLVVITTNLVQILPSSPSAVGVFEAATIVALRAYGVPDSRALSYALVVHALNFLPFVAAGPFVLRGSLKLRRRNGGAAGASMEEMRLVRTAPKR